MYFTKEQIAFLVHKIGQPDASVLINSFFNSYRTYLDSNDVSDLYDANYLKKINSLPTYLNTNSCKIHIFSKFSYEYLIKKLKPNDRILDIGCGSGEFALAIANQGVEVIGIDFSEAAIEMATLKAIQTDNTCQFICADVSGLGDTKVFDYIILNDVIEHLSDRELENIFKKIWGILSETGEVLIHTPNGLALCNDTDSNFMQKILKIYKKKNDNWRGHERTVEQIYYDQVHINIKSYRQLKLLLRKFGFKTLVKYDDTGKWPFLDQFSSNMLVIAKK